MSVINQMLKDLDKRQAEHRPNVNAVNIPAAPQNKSSYTFVLVIIVTVVTTLVASYFWQLQKENEVLKQSLPGKIQPVSVTEPVANPTKAQEKQAPVKQVIVKQEQVIKKVTGKVQQAAKAAEIPAQQNAQQGTLPNAKKINGEENAVRMNEALPSSGYVVKKVEDKSVEQTNIAVEQPRKVTPVEKQPQATLSITRRKLTPEQLSAKKMQQAELAIMENELSKAEHLFEDILLLLPRHHNARKQLAALWFGRQSYQPAVNLLLQGIALAPNNSEFRLMQARIYLQQGQNEQALHALQALPNLADIEYQSLRATIAQQLSKANVASSAYKVLTQMQPEIGRWWLGLAIAYDSNSQFTLAAQAYKTALAQNNLSTNSTQFAQQRIVQLGE